MFIHFNRGEWDGYCTMTAISCSGYPRFALRFAGGELVIPFSLDPRIIARSQIRMETQ